MLRDRERAKMVFREREREIHHQLTNIPKMRVFKTIQGGSSSGIDILSQREVF